MRMTALCTPEGWLGQSLPVAKGQQGSMVSGLGWSIKADTRGNRRDKRRADARAEVCPDATALGISGREQGQVLAKCGSCPDAQLTDAYAAGRLGGLLLHQ